MSEHGSEHADQPQPGSSTQGQQARTVDQEAERAVEIAAALTYIDQARHLLDGRHTSCQVCSSYTLTRTRQAEDGEDGEVLELVLMHQTDCPVYHLQQAWERLTWIYTHDA